MSRRRIEALKPFDFRADFIAGHEEDTSGNAVRLAPDELAGLGAQLYADGAAKAQARLDAQAAARLDDALSRMESAVQAMRELSDALDRLGRQGALPAGLATLGERAAQTLADGQGDLFAFCESLEPPAGDEKY
jgi:hypothetical protein